LVVNYQRSVIDYQRYVKNDVQNFEIVILNEMMFNFSVFGPRMQDRILS